MSRKKPARPRWGSEGNPLATRQVIALTTGRNPETISRRCTPVACDVRTRASLYDMEEVSEVFRKLRKRAATCQRTSASSTFGGGEVRPKVETSAGAGNTPEARSTLVEVDVADDTATSLIRVLGEDLYEQLWTRVRDLSSPDGIGPPLIQIAIWVEKMHLWGVTITPAIWERMLDDLLVKEETPERETPLGVVYYLRVGHLIKVGWSGSLERRLNAYPPHSTVLATEPGYQVLERQRHIQFKEHLEEGREWFRPGASLLDHINSLRDHPLTPQELT